MKIELTKQECKWLSGLANKAKIEADRYNEQSPHRINALRRDNMAELETKLNTALQRQAEKERRAR